MTNEQLIEAYRSGDKAALEQLIMQNKGLIAKLANKYMPMYKGGDYDDLMQEGSIGLMRAVETYDQSKGKFSTYAFLWIQHAMLKAMRGQVDTISLDETIADDSDTTLGDMLCDGNDFTEQVDDSLTADNLWFAIQRELTDLQFKIFALSVYDYPIAHIAARLGIPLNLAKKEKRHALYKLRWQSHTIRRLALEWLHNMTPSYYSSVDYAIPIGHTGYSGTSIVERVVIARDKAIAELLR